MVGAGPEELDRNQCSSTGGAPSGRRYHSAIKDFTAQSSEVLGEGGGLLGSGQVGRAGWSAASEASISVEDVSALATT